MRDYSIPGSGKDQLFGIFTAISIIGTTYGSGIIPEIQATVAPPVKGKMFKGLCLCYVVVISTFFSVAIAGYWAFGNQAQSNILSNFFASDGSVLVPKSLYMMINFFCIVQIFAVSVVYLQPTNEVLEQLLADPKKHQYSPRNVIPRTISRSLVVAFSTLIAAMIPFFGDLTALIGAFAILPMDFMIPDDKPSFGTSSLSGLRSAGSKMKALSHLSTILRHGSQTATAGYSRGALTSGRSLGQELLETPHQQSRKKKQEVCTPASVSARSIGRSSLASEPENQMASTATGSAKSHGEKKSKKRKIKAEV